MKQCKKCGTITDAFSIERMNKDGFRGACKSCTRKYNQWHYQKNKEVHFAKAEKWRVANREKINRGKQTVLGRYKGARYRAEKSGREWTLTLAEFEELCAQDCRYCNGFFGAVVSGSGLDRLDSTKGYTLDNVWPCCKHCNALKLHSHTPAETLAMVQLLIQMRGPKLHAVK